MDTILVVNAGSSSVKFQIYSVEARRALRRQLKGQMDGIGSRPRLRASGSGWRSAGRSRLSDRGGVRTFRPRWTSPATWLRDELSIHPIAVGHRVVHGGPDYDQAPVRIDHARVVTRLERYIALAPLHQPAQSGSDPIAACAISRRCRRSPASIPRSTASRGRGRACQRRSTCRCRRRSGRNVRTPGAPRRGRERHALVGVRPSTSDRYWRSPAGRRRRRGRHTATARYTIALESVVAAIRPDTPAVPAMRYSTLVRRRLISAASSTGRPLRITTGARSGRCWRGAAAPWTRATGGVRRRGAGRRCRLGGVVAAETHLTAAAADQLPDERASRGPAGGPSSARSSTLAGTARCRLESCERKSLTEELGRFSAGAQQRVRAQRPRPPPRRQKDDLTHQRRPASWSGLKHEGVRQDGDPALSESRCRRLLAPSRKSSG